jgi:hypothetical protein
MWWMVVGGVLAYSKLYNGLDAPGDQPMADKTARVDTNIVRALLDEPTGRGDKFTQSTMVETAIPQYRKPTGRVCVSTTQAQRDGLNESEVSRT